MARVWPMVSALAQMTSWSGQNIGCFSPNPFYVGWLAWFQVRLHPSPLKYFLEPVFARFATAVRQRGQKNTWKHQILAKSHTNYFGRLVAKFQQTAISSICLGAFRRFSAMISASFSYLISASEEGVDVGDWNPFPASAITGASLQCTVQMSQCIILTAVQSLFLHFCSQAALLLLTCCANRPRT